MRLTAGLVGLVTTMSVGAAVLVGAGSSGADRSEPVPAGADRIIGSQKGVVAQNAEFAATVHRFPATQDLDGRAAPRLDARTLKVNAYRKGAAVPVVCQLKGETAYGSNIWDKTSDGYCVADAYVRTGYSGFVPGLAKCTGVPPTHPPTGRTVKGIDISSNRRTTM